MKFLSPFVTTIILVLLPLSVAWFFYFPLSLFSVFILRRIYSTIFGGLILDSIYFSADYQFLPLLTTTSLATVIAFILLKDKIRLPHVVW